MKPTDEQFEKEKLEAFLNAQDADFQEMEERTLPSVGAIIWPLILIGFAFFLSWLHGIW